MRFNTSLKGTFKTVINQTPIGGWYSGGCSIISVGKFEAEREREQITKSSVIHVSSLFRRFKKSSIILQFLLVGLSLTFFNRYK